MHDLVLHPATKALHYAVQLFEGLKAYRGFDGKIRLFRPELNIDRCELLCLLPTNCGGGIMCFPVLPSACACIWKHC